MKGMLAIAVVAASVTLAAQVMSPVAGDPVTIDSGRVSGSLSGGIKTYFGIPFAAPPLRENRWREPQPVTRWSGVLTATRKPAECVQNLRSSSQNHYFGDELAGEDCLYLNLWSPASAKAGAKLPVVVWIYGGAFSLGSASSPIYGGESLAKKGVIYVAANYRVGLMGFLAHPDLTKESGHNASGNWGFLDQVAALKWVKRNIAAFGGDPANVTLIGQSAGSMSINNLQASPLAKGLFARVIGLSGATVRGGPADATGTVLASAEAQGTKLQAALKAQSLAEMRTLSSDKLVVAAQQAGVRTGPDIDGYYLPDTVDHIFAAGTQSDVAVLTGHTANDIGTTPVIRSARTVPEYQAAAKQMYGDKAADFLKLFPAATDAEVVRQADQVGRNFGFGMGARNWARAQTRTGKQPAYLYILSRVQPFAPGVTFSDFEPATAGAYHMGDVPYFLGTYEAFNLFRTTRNWTAWDRELSNAIQDVIVTFARTGTPVTATVPFARYDPKQEVRIDFGDRITVEKMFTAGLDFIDSVPAAAAPGRGARGGGGRR